MPSDSFKHAPTEIKLHRKSRILSVAFSDGSTFELPCEYLRVFSGAEENSPTGTPVSGKENVNIEQVESQGNYAIRIFFDDGHDSGIYSWETLYMLGMQHDSNWSDYLARLATAGIDRQEPVSGPKQVRILYFIELVKVAGKDTEDVQLPESVTNVRTLLAWLRKRGSEWEDSLQEPRVQVTVNKQFTEPFTRLDTGDEVALVPRNRMV